MTVLLPERLAGVNDLDPAQRKLRAEAHRWAVKATQAVARRNAAIVALHEAGVGYREIGRAVGLSHVAVRKIAAAGSPAAE